MSEVKVRVTDETSSSTTTISNSKAMTAQKAANQLDPKNEAAKESKNNSTTIAVASMMASRALSYTATNVGKWTGNSRNQDKVNMLQQAIGTGMTAVVSPALAIASIGIQLGTTAFEISADNRLESQRSAARKLRAGYYNDDKVLGGRK